MTTHLTEQPQKTRLKWVDIGINLTNRRYAKDRQQVIDRAQKNGVDKLIITGTSVSESEQALALAQSRPGILFATAGCHPHDAKSLDNEGMAKLERLAKQPAVVAIGECGLDFNRNFSPPTKQIEAFEKQLELAIALQKPLFLHERDAFDTQFSILKQYREQIGDAVIHCFTSDKHKLAKYLDLNLYIGVTGWICDERRGQDLYQAVAFIPDDRLMLETDGPYLTPRNLSPKPTDNRNEPQYLPHIAQTVANARNQSLQHLSDISYTNSCRFFNLS
ncbi:TatD family hydrolase [Aliikangiella maris]|uniref:TatD family hydrolase n=2 Tax=Aliikangiella maris TaxID=3162458 RepID=A0ABV2BXA1_9GAMM